MTRDELDALSKDELYELATDADVSGRSGMSKGELVDALADDAPAGDSRTIPPGGIDPILVQRRDELRAREDAEAEAAAAAATTGPVELDPELARIREETRAADAASESSATASPQA